MSTQIEATGSLSTAHHLGWRLAVVVIILAILAITEVKNFWGRDGAVPDNCSNKVTHPTRNMDRLMEIVS